MYETSDEWIYTRTGIKERRVVSGNESAVDLGVKAAENALNKSGFKAEDIDCVIAAASAPPQLYPALACDIQTRLGIPNYVPSFDLTAACTGLIYSLQVARGLIGSGLYKNILIVAADNNSRLVDWKDRGTSILFGDGAGAMVVTEAEDGVDDIMSLDVRADGSIGQYISLNMAGENCPLVEPCDVVDSKVHMAGRDVYKFVVSTLPNYVDKAIELAGLKAEDINYLIPHQANQRIIEALQQRLQYSDEKLFQISSTMEIHQLHLFQLR